MTASGSHDTRRAIDGPRDVAVGGIQQRPPDDQATNVRHLHRSCHDSYVASGSGPGDPPRINAGSVVHANIRAGSLAAGTFSQVDELV